MHIFHIHIIQKSRVRRKVLGDRKKYIPVQAQDWIRKQFLSLKCMRSTFMIYFFPRKVRWQIGKTGWDRDSLNGITRTGRWKQERGFDHCKRQIAIYFPPGQEQILSIGALQAKEEKKESNWQFCFDLVFRTLLFHCLTNSRDAKEKKKNEEKELTPFRNGCKLPC